MSWQIQLEGSKEGVLKALDEEKLEEGNPDAPSYEWSKKTIASIIALASPTHNAVRVIAAGHHGQVIRLEVEGRFLHL